MTSESNGIWTFKCAKCKAKIELTKKTHKKNIVCKCGNILLKVGNKNERRRSSTTTSNNK